MTTSYNDLFVLESIGTPNLRVKARGSTANTQVNRRLCIGVVDWDSYNKDYADLALSYGTVLSLNNRVHQLDISQVRRALQESDLYLNYYSDHLLKTVNEIGSACRLTTKIEYSLMA